MKRDDRPGFDLSKRFHLVGIAGQDHDQPLAVVLGPLEQRLDRLAAVHILPFSRHEAVRFVDEQHAVERLVDLGVRFGAGLAHVFGHQAGAVGLDEVAFLQNAHRAKDLAEDPGDGRFAGARVAGEDHVQAHIGVRQPASPRRCCSFR